MKIRNSIRLAAVCLNLLVLIATACADQTGTPQPALVPTSEPAGQAETTSTPAVQTLTNPPLEIPSETTAAETTTESGDAADFPDAAQFEWSPVATGFTKPTDLADPADGSGRLLVLEQAGTIRIVENGQVSGTPFLDITNRVGSDSSEQGLLGMALDPAYAENGIFYLNYTDRNGDTVVSRFHRLSGGETGDPASEEVLLQADQPFANHNGGDLEFGPDGMLYIGLGDGGSGGDPRGNAQNTGVLLGKMLRVDVRDGSGGYTIPADNPFATGGGKQEVWAWGLRNPWRYSFDRQTGDLYIADVGQNKYEEVNFLAAGSPPGTNFGWNYREAFFVYKGNPPAGMELIDPVFEYDHEQGCSVTGGYVYRGKDLPEFQGIYLFGDYCSGYVWGMLRGADGSWQTRQLFSDLGNISSFGQDDLGELYLLDHRIGSILRLTRK